jgi:hypothetical protein
MGRSCAVAKLVVAAIARPKAIVNLTVLDLLTLLLHYMLVQVIAPKIGVIASIRPRVRSTARPDRFKRSSREGAGSIDGAAIRSGRRSRVRAGAAGAAGRSGVGIGIAANAGE